MNKDAKIYLILHNIRSCYNVGSIFRTADAAGVSKIYLCGYTPMPYGWASSSMLDDAHKALDKIAKTSLGAEKFVPWEKHKQTWRLLKELKEKDIRIIALEQTPRSRNLFSFNISRSKNYALLVGHERKGLSGKILKYVDDIVEIPMYGKKESLNVSVATGIALYYLKNALTL